MNQIDFVAEVSSNHNRDIGRMKEIIHSSYESGCTGVKFQLFKIDDLFSPEILIKSKKHRDRRNWELSDRYIPELSELTRSLGMKFSCTPFYLEAVDILEPYVDFYKIASYELLWLDLFEKCGNKAKPVVFSTGMANENEIISSLKCLQKTRCKDVIILHCNSAYPTPIEDANLAAIGRMNELITPFKNQINVKIGYSDHTVSTEVVSRAISHYNVDFIEFHIDLDGKGEEYQSGHCWLPDQVKNLTTFINVSLEADGSKKIQASPSELPDRDWRADPSDGLRPLKKIRNKF